MAIWPLVCNNSHQSVSISITFFPPLSVSLCVLFTWLTCSFCAGSFVHQKAPAPGDCLLTFLSRDAQMNVSSQFLSPAFCFFFFSFSKFLWPSVLQADSCLCHSGLSEASRSMLLSGKGINISSLHSTHHVSVEDALAVTLYLCKMGIQAIDQACCCIDESWVTLSRKWCRKLPQIKHGALEPIQCFIGLASK